MAMEAKCSQIPHTNYINDGYFFGTKYTLTNDQLQIDNGFSVQKIEITDIT